MYKARVRPFRLLFDSCSNMMGVILWVFVLVGVVYGAEVRVDPLVLISGQGLVSGQKATDGDYSMFLGIPYATVNTDNPFGVSSTK